MNRGSECFGLHLAGSIHSNGIHGPTKAFLQPISTLGNRRMLYGANRHTSRLFPRTSQHRQAQGFGAATGK